MAVGNALVSGMDQAMLSFDALLDSTLFGVRRLDGLDYHFTAFQHIVLAFRFSAAMIDS
jgi:hypothetical protein